ncbi:WD40/YVTN/BNR-like repeat-containing protein [Spirosoma sp. KNUC1025]|uniref:WD40/YVTN/BNR-like repeat-containing protein n=1 Tax=Spirosoma sp. KNUC1025 TaxID=2894082 RepID=UPI00386DDC2B|nr:hypothetical protein LN737_20525 [Spirosoma sp. KNUC1025]
MPTGSGLSRATLGGRDFYNIDLKAAKVVAAGNRLYSLVYPDGHIKVSTDQGQTWSVTYSIFPAFGRNLVESFNYYDIKADPVFNRIYGLSIESDLIGGSIYVYDGTGNFNILRGFDEAVRNGPYTLGTVSPSTLAVSGNTILAGATITSTIPPIIRGTGYIKVGTRYGLLISKDGGQSFTTTDLYYANGVKLDIGATISAICINPTNGHYYVGTASGLFMSSDYGSSFQLVDTSNWPSNLIKAVYAQGNTVYVGTDNGLFISDDGAKTFQRALRFNDTDIQQITVANGRLWVAYQGIYGGNGGIGFCPPCSPITIIGQPANQAACSANNNGLQYTVQAESNGNPLTFVTYDWEFNDNDGNGWISLSKYANLYPGYNTATLTTNGIETPGRQYRVNINNGCNYSQPATFTLSAPSIITQPISQTACDGNRLQYEVKADGNGSPLTYEWEINDNDGKGWISLSEQANQYPSYNTATLTSSGVEPNGRQYRVKINNGSCTVYSEPATFTRTPGPRIVAQPISQTACSSKGLQYEVKVDGDALGYLWEYNDGQGWIPLGSGDGLYSGYDTATLTTNGDEPDGRQYRVFIRYTCNVEPSQPATFTRAPRTSIIAQPTSRTACSGKGLQYTVNVEGYKLSYDWEYSDGGAWASLSFDGGVYPGYNTNTLTTNGDEPNGRRYRVKISNDCGTDYSESVTFTQAQCTLTLTNFSAAPKSVVTNQLIAFTATVGNATGPYNYTLTNGAGSTQTGTASGSGFSQRLTAQGTGLQTYTLTIGDSPYSVTSTVPVTVVSFAISGLKASANPVQAGQSVEFTATLDGLTNNDLYSYTLTNGQHQPLLGDFSGTFFQESVTAQGIGSQTYVLTVSTASKGTATAMVSVTVTGESVGQERFALRGAELVDCQLEDSRFSKRYKVSLQPRYVGQDPARPISFSVVGELSPTATPGPYTLHLWGDNPVIRLVAQQGNAQTQYAYNWQNDCPILPTGFALTGARVINCQVDETGFSQRYKVSLQPQYVGQDPARPISFSVVGELSPTTTPGPYTLHLWGDNPVIRLVAQQGNAQTQYAYNWLASCQIAASARRAVAEEISTGMQVRLLGNPITNHQLNVEIKGVEGQPVYVTLTDLGGRHLASERIERSDIVEVFTLRTNPTWGNVLLLKVRVVSPTGSHQQIVKVIQD